MNVLPRSILTDCPVRNASLFLTEKSVTDSPSVRPTNGDNTHDLQNAGRRAYNLTICGENDTMRSLQHNKIICA